MRNDSRKESGCPSRKSERMVLMGADLRKSGNGTLVTLILLRFSLPGLFADLSFSWKAHFCSPI